MRGSSPFATDFFAIKTLKYMRMNTINNHENQGCCVLLVELVRRWPLSPEVDGSSLLKAVLPEKKTLRVSDV